MRIHSETHHVIVAEESPIIREGLLQLLCHLSAVHIHTVAVATRHSLEDMLRVRSFHMVFVSPDFGGGFDVRSFRLQHPEIPCVAIVSEVSQLAHTAEYSGYITIHSSMEDVQQIIASSRESTMHLVSEDGADLNVLSTREREILVELARGFSNKEIAAKLNIALYTVNTHRRNICQKLNIHSVAGLTVYALAHRLIEM